MPMPILEVWFDTAVEAEQRGLEDVRESFPSADMVGDLADFQCSRQQLPPDRAHGVSASEGQFEESKCPAGHAEPLEGLRVLMEDRGIRQRDPTAHVLR